jgi:hypothetical protein
MDNNVDLAFLAMIKIDNDDDEKIYKLIRD